jgi:DNA replication and repair protein RecF
VIKINGLKVPVSALIGLQPQIFFNPETVELVFESPQLRRRELDMVLTQSDHEFVVDILSFKKILKQRNSLLRMVSQNKSKVSELDFWDERFIFYASKIYQKRRELVDFYNRKIADFFTSLSQKEGELKLRYLPTLDYSRIEEVLVAHRNADIESGLTSVGPHRDDFAFFYDGKQMRQGSSRGEQRLAAVAFKASASEYLLEKGIRPIIILDDVFSELDPSRQHSVAETLGLFKVHQVFVSATDEKNVPDILLERSNVLRLNDEY